MTQSWKTLALQAVVIGAAITSCQTKSTEKTVSTVLPKMNLISGKTGQMKRGKVSIYLEPVTYVTKVDHKRTVREAMDPVTGLVNMPSHVTVTNDPILEPSPKNLQFNVTIKNAMNRVVRLSETVIRFRTDKGSLSQDHYDNRNFSAELVLPGETKTLKLHGPAVSVANELGAQKLIVDLFDVPTNIDKAGKVRGRSNFSWIYGIGFKPVSKKANHYVETINKSKLDAELLYKSGIAH